MNEVEQFADPVQQAFDRAGVRQVQLDPILVLHDPHGQLEQLQDDRHRLRPGQFGMAQRVLVQAVRGAEHRTATVGFGPGAGLAVEIVIKPYGARATAVVEPVLAQRTRLGEQRLGLGGNTWLHARSKMKSSCMIAQGHLLGMGEVPVTARMMCPCGFLGYRSDGTVHSSKSNPLKNKDKPYSVSRATYK